MEDEHCEENLGCDLEFTTTNYGITTTPKKEYEIAMDPRKCPEAERKNKRNEVVRHVRSLDDLVEMPMTKDARLLRFEVKAVVSALRLIFMFAFIFCSR
jgi:hypothetical protein